jgi:hypothetical protein
MAIRIHVSCLTYQHNYLDLDPTGKGAYGLTLLRMTCDWHGNDPRMMRNMNKRGTNIGRALVGSGLRGKWPHRPAALSGARCNLGAVRNT